MSMHTPDAGPAGLFRSANVPPPPSPALPIPASAYPPPYAGPIEVRRPGAVSGDAFILLFGVLLPAAVLVIELCSRMCADELFNPLPTWFHVAAVASVPLANLLAWSATLRPTNTRWLPLLGILNGFATGVALCYAIVFAPLLPVAVIAVLIMGIGFLPLGPLFGFIAAVVCRRRLRHATPDGRPRRVAGLWPGFAAAVLVLVASVLPAVLTQHGLGLAASPDARERDAGLRFLRTWGSEHELLRACYWRGRGDMNPLTLFSGGAGRRADVAEARRAFYRVTGTSFDAHPAPVATRGLWDADPTDDNEWELRGGERVGGLLSGLSVASSRIDGSVNADAGTSYFEWTLEFRNAQPYQQEARCRIALPPDGVVSRLTLWINGEEREAAFGRRAQVRAAYEQVVKVERRDPVLVTTAGPDRVHMQCFPVPAGGVMKVRVGITAPLQLDSPGSGTARLPCFADRNFALPADLTHGLWVETRTPVAFPATEGLRFGPSPAKAGAFELKGFIADAALEGRVPLTVSRPADGAAVWFDDPYDASVGTVVQRVEAYTEPPPARVVLVVDASASVAQAIPALADALAGLPDGIDVSAVVSRDGTITLTGGAAAVAAGLRKIDAVGGQDSVPALVRAWDLASASPNAVVLWVHGPQPELFEPTEAMKQRIERAAGAPRVLHLQASPGRNEVLDQLAEIVRLEAVPSSGGTGEDLKALFARWKDGTPRWRFARTAGERPGDANARRGDIEVVRLWAHERVLAMSARPALGQSSQAGPAADLAVKHHLVTPVSGAVVLETQRQYDAAGLSPVMAIPLPPAVWVMLAMAPLVWWASRAHRRVAHR